MDIFHGHHHFNVKYKECFITAKIEAMVTPTLTVGEVVKKSNYRPYIFFQLGTVNTHTFFLPDIYEEKHCAHICIKEIWLKVG